MKSLVKNSIFHKIKHFWNQSLRGIFPPFCLHCDAELLVEESTLCQSCQGLLELVSFHGRCPQCYAEVNGRCKSCAENPTFLYKYAPCFEHTGPIQSLVSHFKYQNKPYLSEALGSYLAAQFIHLNWPLPDLIVPVPLSRLKKFDRGYNQSLLLAETLGAILQRPVANVLIRRSGHFSQAALARDKRLQLSKSMFSLKKGASLHDKTVLLVDDVATTGSTLSRCAEILLNHYATCVYGLTLTKAE